MHVLTILLLLFAFAGENESLHWVSIENHQDLESVCPDEAALKKIPKGDYLFGSRINFYTGIIKNTEKDSDTGCKIDWKISQSKQGNPKTIEQISTYSNCKDKSFNRQILEKIIWTDDQLTYSIVENKIEKTCKYKRSK